MNKAKKVIIGGGAALFGAGYLIGRQQNNKSVYEKFLDRIDKALD